MRAWSLLLLFVSCGTPPGPSAESPEELRSEQTSPEASEATGTGDPQEVRGEADEEASEADGDAPNAPVADGPRNFLTPHHCHPPGPCTFEFETLRGAQHIDVGHGHVSAPRLDIVLRVHGGAANLDGVSVNSGQREASGVVIARPRDSLEGGAFYVTLNGDAQVASVELSFRSE